MKRILSILTLFMMLCMTSFAANAQDKPAEKAAAPAEAAAQAPAPAAAPTSG